MAATSLTSPALATVLPDALVVAVRARVLDGDLPPGAALIEAEMAREYQV